MFHEREDFKIIIILLLVLHAYYLRNDIMDV
jgi:hypothetical protein